MRRSRFYPCPYFVNGQWCRTAVRTGDRYRCDDCGSQWDLDGNPLPALEVISA